jgi:hypothetical protein
MEGLIAGLITLFMGTLFGTLILASGDKPLALRETAINTRRDKNTGSAYTFLIIQSILLKVLGILVIALCCVLAILVGQNFNIYFPAMKF